MLHFRPMSLVAERLSQDSAESTEQAVHGQQNSQMTPLWHSAESRRSTVNVVDRLKPSSADSALTYSEAAKPDHPHSEEQKPDWLKPKNKTEQ